MRKGTAQGALRVPKRLLISLLLVATFSTLGCGVQVYNLGGAGRGTKFILPPGPAASQDPVVQSWVAYSLALSTCQLEMGGDLPSSYSSFECESRSRSVLAKRWEDRKDRAAVDPYLETLSRVRAAGFLDEYVWVFLRELSSWKEPELLDLAAFKSWRATQLEWHRPKTRIIGYWMNP